MSDRSLRFVQPTVMEPKQKILLIQLKITLLLFTTMAN